MFERWLTKLETVKRATTPEEREAIYRFRYTVYVEELGRVLGGADHTKKTVTDPDDEKDFSVHLYTGTPDELTGSVRLRCWEPGGVPQSDFQLLSMDDFPDIKTSRVAELGRLMIRPTLRGKLILPSLARATYEHLAGEFRGDLAFCYCAPGLVHHYRKLGFRPYSGRIVDTVDGIHVAMVCVLSDGIYLKEQGSPVAALAKTYYTRARRDADMRRYESVLDVEQVPIEMDGDRVWGQVQDAFVQADSQTKTFLEMLPAPAHALLKEHGMVLDLTKDTLVTKEGYGERELFIILDGAFEVLAKNGRRVAVLGKGDLFGEVAFFRESGKRSASIKALSDGRVLSIRRRALDELIAKKPEIAAPILFQLGRIMAERIANSLATQSVATMIARDDL